MRLPDFPIEGGCQCGAVRYRLTAPPITIYNCYCKDCQRFSGATHSMSMVVTRESLEVLSGTFAAHERTANSGRVARMHACADCGTKLWNEPLAAPDIRILKPGTLDDMSWAAPVGNIWTARRAPWVTIDETLVNFEGQPPDRQPLYDAWTRRMSAPS
jgi:hypothetical protein